MEEKDVWIGGRSLLLLAVILSDELLDEVDSLRARACREEEELFLLVLLLLLLVVVVVVVVVPLAE